MGGRVLGRGEGEQEAEAVAEEAGQGQIPTIVSEIQLVRDGQHLLDRSDRIGAVSGPRSRVPAPPFSHLSNGRTWIVS